MKIVHAGDVYSKDEVDNKYSLSETGTTYEYGGLTMATVKEVKLMKDEAMVAPVVLVDSIKNLDGTKFKDSVYTKTEIDTKISALQNSINETSKKVMPKKWTAISQNIITDTIFSICYENGKYIAGGAYNGQMAYSTDGINWTAVNQYAYSKGGVYSLCYGNGKFIAGGYKGQMAYSTNGINWTAINQNVLTSTVYALCYGNGKFVAGDQDGHMAYSADGINWTAITQSIFTYTNSACYGNGKFILGGSLGQMAYAYAGPPF